MICTLGTLKEIVEKYSTLTVREFIELVKKGELKWIEQLSETK